MVVRLGTVALFAELVALVPVVELGSEEAGGEDESERQGGDGEAAGEETQVKDGAGGGKPDGFAQG